MYAISVIIPMYKRKQYIRGCFDSLLAQTFQNFEVIVIDDCSTYRNVKMVEGYKEQFGERLKLICLEENSGYLGELLNKGISLAAGEYIYFLDSDDAIIKIALEEMYKLAKDFDADVVYCEKYYVSEGTEEDFVNNMRIADSDLQTQPFVDDPTFESADLSERVKKLLAGNYLMSPSLWFVKLDLLIDNNISFPSSIKSGDEIWATEILFCSKHFLRTPNACYIRRIQEQHSFDEQDTSNHIQRWMDAVIRGLKNLDNFIGEIEFFKENPDQRYEILAYFVKRSIANVSEQCFEDCSTESLSDVYNIFKEKFGSYLGDNDVLVAGLCTYLVRQQKDLWDKQRPNQDFRQQSDEQEAEIEQLKSTIFNLMPTLPALQSNSPAISVIIPMYNAEEYIGECLNSLLAQTFQDFEVIVVDDCSDDNGVKIVESYAPKFNGRLHISQTETNSGGGGYVPRNDGLKLAHGEYVFFVDSDDFISETALDILYRAAKEYDADVVYTSNHYMFQSGKSFITRDNIGKALFKENIEDEPTLIVDEPDKLLDQLLLNDDLFHMPWVKFVAKNLLIENEIEFPKIISGGDFIWTIPVLYHSKRFLRLPTAVYFYRDDAYSSITRKKLIADKQIPHCVSAFLFGIKTLHNLTNKIDLLKKNAMYIHSATIPFFNNCMKRTFTERVNLDSQFVYDILKRAFANESDNLTAPFFFSILDQREKETTQLKQQIAEQQAEFRKVTLSITARVDVQFVSEKGRGDFQILSVSDDKANVDKPAWFQKNGIGYQIESLVGRMEIVAKATTDGRINMKLRGVDVSNSANKSERVPYWIDYTRLTINGKKVIDKPTPAWHGKPYNYSLDAKANDKIKIEIEWLPHKDDKSAVTTAVTKTQENNVAMPRKYKPSALELRTALTSRKMTSAEAIQNKREEMLRNTARLDIKLKGASSFPIQTISDSEAKIIQPAWMLKGGAGYIVTSHVGKLELVAQAEADGQLSLNLRGMDIKNPKDNSKRLPYWIDYTKLVVNGKVIFDKVTPVWHDEPYSYEINVKAGEKVRIQLEWLPHRNNT